MGRAAFMRDPVSEANDLSQLLGFTDPHNVVLILLVFRIFCMLLLLCLVPFCRYWTSSFQNAENLPRSAKMSRPSQSLFQELFVLP
jgi:hypothetical protein